MPKPVVDVVIVNYRTPELAIEAAQSVFGEPEVGTVFIVDNDGPINAELYAKALPPQRVTVIPLANNVGFGPANNVAARQSTAEYLFFLNPDAYILPGCVGDLTACLKQDKHLGMIAPAVYLPDKTTLQSDAQGNFPTPWQILTRQSTQVVDGLHPDWVSGVAFLVRREEFMKLGGFNERLFLYYEDVELCWRYRQNGLTIARLPSAKVVHLGGQSQISSKNQKDRYYQAQDSYLRIVGASMLGRLLVRLIRAPYRILKGW